MTKDRTRQNQRLKRQFDLLERKMPGLRGLVRRLQDNRLLVVRVPLAIIFIASSVLAFLPVLGLWMLPVGLLLLAVDVPLVRPMITGFVIRARRRITIWQRWLWPNRSN